MGKIKQVLIVRKDLNMRRGKEDAQCSHASQAFMVPVYLNGGKPTKDAVEWFNSGQTKITVSVDSEEKLLDIFKQAKSMGLETHIITDAGHTEFNGIPTKTVVAIGPNDASKIDTITGSLPLR